MTPEAFEPHRGRLTALAYRMLGSIASAEDMVQETWLRWTAANDVQHPAAWLTTVCTRLCLDEARSARAQRETYVGPWLPEPWVEADPGPGVLGETLTMAFLLLLQRLTPRERAAWLLREVFDQDYDHVAEVLHTTPAACRQLLRRARTAIAAERPRFDADPDHHLKLLAVFGQACVSGDVEQLETLLAEEVQFVGDGGGHVSAAMRPVLGRNAVARLLVGLARKQPPDGSLELAVVNGMPGVILRWADGRPHSVLCIETRDGVVVALRNVRNPSKLGHLHRDEQG